MRARRIGAGKTAAERRLVGHDEVVVVEVRGAVGSAAELQLIKLLAAQFQSSARTVHGRRNYGIEALTLMLNDLVPPLHGGVAGAAAGFAAASAASAERRNSKDFILILVLRAGMAETWFTKSTRLGWVSDLIGL